ncbi:heparan-alpha-glucosaminide N-acetyltransferase domain-containing protein [Candidatus Methylospira mobilis]|uniref:heparan-alpha-glucosaminide N-acetyltransferase domain-containing protein n=1 Tax=Candidatus Methylospira mobilis TaxID=1808979 RepID=UPI0028E8084B|nr:heparan-alpha-glucosaminide N-acetyltransferase domain-containing protein [Candidatus Methylospira mobilis]WNV06557.1 heparan-alpha-glucosaminide N-acetyltransferase domain-containing protein [Candidatus Methylospira mobilis]
MHSAQNRIVQYDMLRGLAISLMLMANSAASVLIADAPHPFLMRLAGSFAAPIFMLLAGMMLALAKRPKPSRGLFIMIVGGLIDMAVWQSLPFLTFDVLYTIGLAIIVTAYPARYFSATALALTGFALLLCGQLLQWGGLYHFELFSVGLNFDKPLPPVREILPHIPQQLFIDGWFPVFPWLGFVWLGAALQRSLPSFAPEVQGAGVSWRWGRYSTLLLLASSGYWAMTFNLPAMRDGYSELFYPPGLGYCLTAISAFCVLLFVMQWLMRHPRILILLSPLVWMGRRSLWVYVFHVALIRYWLSKCCVTPDPVKFLWVVLMLWTLSAWSARYLPAFSFPSRR